MRSMGFGFQSLIAVLMVAGVLTVTGAQAQAVTKYARITFHTAVCPENTGDLFNKCHDDRLAGADFTVINPSGHGTTKTTNANGEVSFGPRAGWNGIIGREIDDFEGAYVYCSVQNRGHVVLFDGRADDGDLSIQTKRGDVIICDWYYLT
jgi:hypothetical protein